MGKDDQIFELPTGDDDFQQDLEGLNVVSESEKFEREVASAVFRENLSALRNYRALMSSLIRSIELGGNQEVELSDGYNLKIRVKGDSWVATVDERICRVVLRYQEELNKVLDQMSLEYGPAPRLLIKVKLTEGSAILDFLFDNLIKEGFKSMSDDNKKAILVALILTIGGTALGITALWTMRGVWEKSLEEKARVKIAEKYGDQAENQTKMISEMVGEQMASFERIVESVNQASAAPKYLIKKLDDEDSVQLPLDQKLVKKEVVAKRFVAHRSKGEDPLRETIYEDFLVSAISFKDPSEPVLSLECRGYRLAANLSIVGKESAGIAEEVKNALQEGRSLELPLNVHIFHRNGDVIKAKVLGMGARLDGACAIEEVLSDNNRNIQ